MSCKAIRPTSFCTRKHDCSNVSIFKVQLIRDSVYGAELKSCQVIRLFSRAMNHETKQNRAEQKTIARLLSSQAQPDSTAFKSAASA
jgi:hypothetical protein